MKLSFQLSIAACMLTLSLPATAQNATPTSYAFNKAPLQRNVNVALPLGSIRAKGWLLEQLKLQKDGFTGHAEELYPGKDDLGKDADWLGGTGNSWEKAPYYLKGLIALAYTLDDASLKDKAKKWIEYTLQHQQENGLFGPAKMKDWWPRMPMMYALQSYYEATNDSRVVPFLSKYLKYELANLDQDPLREWGKSRAADNIEIALWVYNKTGEKFLLELAEKLKSQSYPWIDIYSKNQFDYYGNDYQPKHMVNVAQALKFPSIYSQIDQSAYNHDATQNGIGHLLQHNGQPHGLAAGTERLSGTSSVQGVETCTVVEWMQSLETAARILHDPKIGDQLERAAFNALPSQFSKDLKQHTYYTLPNQVVSVKGQHGFNQDYSNSIVPGPYSGFPCCRYNMHMGWPYFVKNSWSATPEGGLAVTAYAPMEVSAKVADNHPVEIVEDTNYPFEEQIRITMRTSGKVSFPLMLRIPSWCLKPQVKLNGKPVAGVRAGSMLTLNRQWTDNDKVVLDFPMHVEVEDQVNNGVSIVRGPLLFALKIEEEKKNINEAAVKGFFETEIRPASAWNYGLILGDKASAYNVKVVKNQISVNPFASGQAPLVLKVQARQIPSWTLDYNRTAAFDLPYSPVESGEPAREVTLVPYGTADLRVSIFPTIGKPGVKPRSYKESFDNNTASGLVIYGGAWFYKDNAIHASPNEDGKTGHGTKIIATGTQFADFIYNADVSINSEGNAGLLFRVSDPAVGSDGYKGYYLGFNPTTGLIEFGKSNGKQWSVIASEKYPLKIRETYKVTVKALGNRFEVFINNSQKSIISTTDEAFKTGSIGLRAYDALITADNIQVHSTLIP